MPEPRVVRLWGGPVSCWVMRLPVKLTLAFAALFALTVCAEGRVQAQDSGSSSQSQPTPPQTPQSPDTQTSNYGIYVASDPLAKVRYDNRWDLSLAPGYDHMKAGPSLLQGANLGGLDANGSFWLTRNWGIEGSGRSYVGTSGTQPNHLNGNGGDLEGPMVKQYFFVGGLEALGPHNKHGALIAHVMFGGVYGNFQKDLLGKPPGDFDFYYNQMAPAAIIGGHMDLNRSEHWVFRITPDAIMTHYTFQPPLPVGSTTLPPSYSQFDVNFAISVGLEYKFTKIKRSTKKGNWVSGW
jgi:hypothetical protein